MGVGKRGGDHAGNKKEVGVLVGKMARAGIHAHVNCRYTYMHVGVNLTRKSRTRQTSLRGLSRHHCWSVAASWLSGCTPNRTDHAMFPLTKCSSRSISVGSTPPFFRAALANGHLDRALCVMVPFEVLPLPLHPGNGHTFGFTPVARSTSPFWLSFLAFIFARFAIRATEAA